MTIASRSTSPTQVPPELLARDDVADLGDLAAGDLDPRELGTAREPDAELRADLGVRPLGEDEVEHRDRLRADADHVVGVHRHAVDADRVVAAEALGDDHLGAHGVGGQRQAGAIVEPQHAGVVARQGDDPRRLARVDRPQAADQRLDGGVRAVWLTPARA